MRACRVLASGRESRATAEISLGALTHNMRVLQRAVGPARPLWPAVKANAYGHGAELVARHLAQQGYDTQCVAFASEAVQLLEAGVGVRRILVLSGVLGSETREFVPTWSHAIEPVCSMPESVVALAAAAKSAGVRVRVHVKVDTGMSRQGVLPQQLPQLWELIQSLAPHLEVRSVMTHFACADDIVRRGVGGAALRFDFFVQDPSKTRRQVELFEQCTRSLPKSLMRHACNSAGIFSFPAAHYDAARPGIAVYGLSPGPGVASALSQQLRPALRLVARVTAVKTLPPGAGVSYSHQFVTARDTTVAVIPLGYGDGILRAQSGRMHVMVAGVRCPQLGRVTMDQMMVDVSQVRPAVRVGSLVTVIGDGITADELAANAGTINYEVTTQLSARVPRTAVD